VSAPMDFTSREETLLYLEAALPSEDASVLAALLDASAANDCDEDDPTTVYRPFWVLANALQTNTSLFESVGSAAGSSVKYRDPESAWRAIMRRQAALDESLCGIPPGFEAVITGGVGSARLTRAYA
jgi:hypothetical protein